MYVCPECGISRDRPGACPADGVHLAEPTPGGLHGQTIGSYRIARVLGAGGMGEVYLGVHPEIGSRVAIKVLANECTKSPELVERFFTEARTVNRIRHENIINVLDMGALADRRPYIVMEFLDGQPMSTVTAHQGVWPLGTLARLAGEILDALGAAHRTGVVHRDLKPDNIFVTPNAHAKVLDFGIAKLLPEYGGGGGSATKTGMLLGTPAYMAPEQVTGGAVTARTDIYALGVILYEAATGKQPLAGATLLDLLTKIATEIPASPRTLRGDMLPEYEAVITKALAKDPAQRFASAHEMAVALKQATAQLPPHAWSSISTSGVHPRVTIGPHSTGKSHQQLREAASDTVLADSASETAPKTQGAQPVPQSGSRSNGVVVATVLGATIIAAAIVFAVARGGGSPAASDAPTAASASNAATGRPARPVDSPVPADEPAPAQPALGGTDVPPKPRAGNRGTPRPSGKPRTVAKTKSTKRSSLFNSKTSKVTKDASGTTIVIGGPPAKNRIKLQVDYNPRKFDARAYLPRARALARTIFPDARLVHFDVGGVRANGYADLTLGSGMEATYWYRSPSRSARPKNAPPGVEVEIRCMIYVIASAKKVDVYPRSFEKCNHVFRPRPRCNLRQVWQRAIKLKAPRNGVAQIDYLDDGWYFQIKGTSFSESIKDDC